MDMAGLSPSVPRTKEVAAKGLQLPEFISIANDPYVKPARTKKGPIS
jgi:hypothetical protein